ncbi:ATPase subunit of ABC transporter with duplicated ATPase domains [Stackebrandtia endophytica]|uniref:ATPase subunit of ABC transporter with duplicated ATPase domains n=1 Tax=Stackebrandtia endophytica TaxID=1496996 RepID=A0A543AZ90_9ACTN|nr:ATP-binding cassette domain-containing protein [Stackebrandtia endophytica]TQL77899.1 ATPase subunit of ABC transporter with duplicated ATPase domains [Stackebrandtia endophytica]
MGYIDVSAVSHTLPNGRVLFSDVSLRVGEGAKVALVGPNGAGKTTLLRMVAGDLPVTVGGIKRVGTVGVMRQFIGSIADDSTLEDLAISLLPDTTRDAAERLRLTEAAIVESDTEKNQLRYAEALVAWGEKGGYDAEVTFDTAATLVLGLPWDRAKHRKVVTLSGGEQKKFALELLLNGSDDVLLLDEPDNFLDVPGKRWLEQKLAGSDKSVLYVSHDRELLANTAQRVVTVEADSAWTHVGGFETWHETRLARNDRLDERRRQWDDEHDRLKRMVAMYKQQAMLSAAMASRYKAAKTRLARFEASGAPPPKPKEQDIRMQLGGGRTGKRSVICRELELDDLTFPFDLEVWYDDRVAVLGANGTGKSHFLRLLGRGGTDPDPATVSALRPVAHSGVARLGARVVPGHFSQTHDRPELVGQTLSEVLWQGDDARPSLPRHDGIRALSRYELAGQLDQRFETLSGGQQARFLILLLELSGATLLLLDEPTDNLDLASADALEAGLSAFEGTVIAVTHDRWFARGFDRYLLFQGDGEVIEVPEPVWDVQSRSAGSGGGTAAPPSTD